MEFTPREIPGQIQVFGPEPMAIQKTQVAGLFGEFMG
jgi:hypothetical protein